MRRFLSILLIMLCTIGLMVNDAQAKRFGGGRSFGVSRSLGSFSRPQGNNSFAQAGSSANRWLGPLAGMAIGGLLASLFMGHGMGTGILTWLALAGIIMFAVRFLRQRTQINPQHGYNHAFYDAARQDSNGHARGNTFTSSGLISDYPAGFDRETFLREAKVQFIRLQAAYDQKNLNDIRQFTTPEVFGEIQLQLHERGNASNQTEVVSLSASLLDVAAEGGSTFASVQFSGMVREEAESAAVPLNEIWHFRSETRGSWLVAGVQQQ